VTITLSQDAIERAGIVVTPVQSGAASTGLRLPGVVEPNAYRQVVVTPLVAGRITSVAAQLGEHVRRGQTMAQIFSPELADAQTRYISARAELQAHEQELRRTERLVEIGAASRQELERIHAEHTARTAEVGSARSRLQLLGMSAPQIDALAPGKTVGASTNVPAPIEGVVTERLANVGLNVDLATKLFTVVDLSTVWVLADVYEKDFARVRVGSPATISTTAYPGMVLQGRVNYIDPQVSPQTRTARLRVEVPNRDNQLRLGMYTDVMIESPSAAAATMIPSSAVQTVGDRHVVFLVNAKEPGKFTEREVRIASTSGEHVEVLAGTKVGDLVVAEGSFFLRAERERLGVRRPAAGTTSTPTAAPVTAGEPKPGGQTATVIVGDQGYEPARLTVRAGVPTRITFVRTSDKTCGTAVVFPTLNIRRELPLNQPVEIEFTPKKTGEVQFVCGMNMLRGTVVVE